MGWVLLARVARSNNFISSCGHHSSLSAIAGLPHTVVVKASEKVEQVVVVERPYNEAAVVVEMSYRVTKRNKWQIPYIVT